MGPDAMILVFWLLSFKPTFSLSSFTFIKRLFSSPNDYSGLISFRIDWLDLFTVQGTLKSLLQHHNSKASIPQCSDFFMVQVSHPYMTARKAITWNMDLCQQSIWIFLIHCLGLSKEQASFNFMTAITVWSGFGAPQNKVCHCFHFFPIYLPWSDGTRYHNLSFLKVEF